jgi:hypothetical protein
MRVIVCGGRNFVDQDFVFLVLSAINARTPITGILHGGAKGADQFADEWAKGICPRYAFHPAWDIYGKSAGPKRNQRMIDEGKPNLVVAFPGNRGTADMVRRAKLAGVPVQLYDRKHI